MRFTWGGAKRKNDLVKHSFDFIDAETVFSGATFTFEDDRFAYAEQRFIDTGHVARCCSDHRSHRAR